ncbi:MAG: hypothetical protein ABJL99_04980 [Aliishimia sp.]
MFGVVIWSDPVSGSAVFWSEDHGDLAYFDSTAAHSAGAVHQRPFFDAGDLVEFDALVQEDRLVARNPYALGNSQSDVLVHALRQAPRMESGGAPVNGPCQTAPVIDFGARKAASGQGAHSFSRRG